jgi:hypothetical protein
MCDPQRLARPLPQAGDGARWSPQQLDADRLRATELFVQERTEDGTRAYQEAFNRTIPFVQRLCEVSADLADFGDDLLHREPGVLHAARYLAAPPISERLRTARRTQASKPQQNAVESLPLECKVSNSPLNNVKRLLRETDGKSRQWTAAYGDHVVTWAVLAGVFKLHNLIDAQQSHRVSIFWEHNLAPLIDFLSAAAWHPRFPCASP